MPEAGIIKIKQEVVTDALDTLAKVKQMLEADDTARAIRNNRPYAFSALTNKIQQVMTNLSQEIIKSLEIERTLENE